MNSIVLAVQLHDNIIGDGGQRFRGEWSNLGVNGRGEAVISQGDIPKTGSLKTLENQEKYVKINVYFFACLE
jgi:hypothetical protein